MNKNKKLAICERFSNWVKKGGGCYCEGLQPKEAWKVILIPYKVREKNVKNKKTK